MSDPCESVLVSALDALATGAGTFCACALSLSLAALATPNERTTSASSCGGRADRRGCSDRGGDWSALPGNPCLATSTGDAGSIRAAEETAATLTGKKAGCSPTLLYMSSA